MIIEFEKLFITQARSSEYFWAIKTEWSSRAYDLGSYETFEKNKEVLESIVEAYRNGEAVFYMPEN